MTYYPTIEEDLARAKEILAEGKSALEQVLDGIVLPDGVTRAQLLQLQGGTIYGKDTYAAYKLLESFVEFIEHCPDVEVLRDPAVCQTPACQGPSAIWRIRTRVLKICQTCGAHAATSLAHDNIHPGSGWPVDHPNYGKPEKQ